MTRNPHEMSDGALQAGAHEEVIDVRKTPHPLLAHLRTPGPHVRGCWALDLMLGKE